MPILFWNCPDEREECFACDDRGAGLRGISQWRNGGSRRHRFGNNARATGGTSEVWHRSKTRRAYINSGDTRAFATAPITSWRSGDRFSITPAITMTTADPAKITAAMRSIMTRLSICELHRQNHPNWSTPPDDIPMVSVVEYVPGQVGVVAFRILTTICRAMWRRSGSHAALAV